MESRRLDVVLLVSGAIVVLELKGKAEAEQADLDQAAAYARDLRCYHKPLRRPRGSRSRRSDSRPRLRRRTRRSAHVWSGRTASADPAIFNGPGPTAPSPPTTSSPATPTAHSPRSFRPRVSSSLRTGSGRFTAPAPRRSRQSTRSPASPTRPHARTHDTLSSSPAYRARARLWSDSVRSTILPSTTLRSTAPAASPRRRRSSCPATDLSSRSCSTSFAMPVAAGRRLCAT